MTGDVLLHPPLWDQAKADAKADGSSSDFDFTPLLAGQKAIVSGADVALCHLETPLAAQGGPFHGYPSFAVPPEIGPALVATGYDACSTASNHTMDAGVAGIDRTLDTLDADGLRHTGSARSAAEAHKVLTFDVRGTKVAMLSYAYGLNGRSNPSGEPWHVNIIDPAKILADAKRAKSGGADVVVVALHWGTEYVHPPTAMQRSLAERLTASPDIDLVYGHHAHVVQPVQKVNGKWVVYGLGNTVAAHNVPKLDNREGLLVRVQLVREASGRWRSGRLDWVPSFMTASPYRWVDLGSALKAGGLSAATKATYANSEQRIEKVVESLGAADQGAHQLTSP
ncbi:CapA family protein [Angustibacter sp. McL0619]|uniref:CapA family protein n=1 Tax=Angustibacter sp. McL0619 TaxID=3415676 RepID=UPI003CE68347